MRQFLTDTLPNNVIKLIFVERKHSRKATLMHALKSSYGRISNPEIITKTDGIDIEVEVIKDVKFKTLYLAGVDSYLERHAMFLSEDALYLLVFNVQLYEMFLKKHDSIICIEM